MLSSYPTIHIDMDSTFLKSETEIEFKCEVCTNPADLWTRDIRYSMITADAVLTCDGTCWNSPFVYGIE